VASALFVNLLTEDNLPYYFRDVERMFGPDEAWGVWARRWTAEEGRHSIVIRDYLTVTRAIDPVSPRAGPDGPGVRRRGRRGPVARKPASSTSPCRSSRRASPIATPARFIGDNADTDVMARVAADENLHFLFYRDLATAGVSRATRRRW